MEHDRGKSEDLPIACTLTPPDFAAKREWLLPGLLAEASGREPIPGGFRWQFRPRPNLVQEAGSVIETEHQCCRFLRFRLLIEPGDGPVSLEVTGPIGTEDFLLSLLEMNAETSPRT